MQLRSRGLLVPLQRLFSRTYATASSGNPSRERRKFLSLDHFVQRQRVISLWREILRTIHRIPDSSTRNEMYEYARGEFERNKGVNELSHIRYLVSTGKTEFDTMKRYVDEQARYIEVGSLA
ncbi:hypothetical protein M501DRAFT_938426 [Patellaria atrata CBS 101060]|uniref:LYR motif-containing protein 2 n=1 Tax=Patellaria atrata CBS 101060 TaxID=1346257 RepID=A0A9P4S8J9_9PEZI|nr:hypothetical protein M501DRAFT_938426 [Patellaria atrata CBS 101060]